MSACRDTHLPLRLEGAVLERGGARVAGPIDLSIEGTGITVLMGPNGAGKTSLLRMLHGLVPLAAGRLHWQGRCPPRARQGYVFQTPVMLRRTVLENVTYPLRLHGMGRQAARGQALEWLERVGLAPLARHPARRLSGGERQKLALARALVREPELLLLDEPCANLDGAATHAIEQILTDVRAGGTRIVMSTHDMGQARRLADDILFVLGGQIHESGPAEAFFAGPETAAARAFLAGDLIR